MASLANFTDFFTRDKFDFDAEKMLAYLEKKTGIKPRARRWRLLPSKRNLGWMRLKPQESQQVWFENTLEWLDWLQDEHPASLRSHYRVDPSLVRIALVEELGGMYMGMV